MNPCHPDRGQWAELHTTIPGMASLLANEEGIEIKVIIRSKIMIRYSQDEDEQ